MDGYDPIVDIYCKQDTIMIKKDVSLTVENIPINGRLFLPDTDHPCPLVCVCHGIPSGNPPDPHDGGYPLLAEQICRHGFGVFIFNFRGTGTDLKGVIDHVITLPQVDPSRIGLFGFSGGAAVSICVAARDTRVSCVAAAACPADFSLLFTDREPKSHVAHYRSIGAIRDEDFPPSTEAWLDGFRQVKPLDYVADIAPRPLLLIHGDDDETVPVSHAHRLYEKAGEPKRLVTLQGAGHRLRHDNRVLDTFITWFGRLV